MTKRVITYIVTGALALVLALAVFNALNLGYENRALAAAVKAQTAANAMNAKQAERERAKLAADIAGRDAVIKTLDAEVGRKNNVIGQMTKRIDALNGDLVNAQTDAERVPILTEMVAQWAAKFTLAEGIIADKDVICFSLNAKYADAVAIGETWRKQYVDEHVLTGLQTAQVKSLTWDLRICRFAGTVKTAAIVGIAAYLLYHLIASK